MAEKNLKAKVKEALKTIRPYIESHGGGFEVVAAKAGKVEIKIKGACLGCPMAQATFGTGMEKLIRKEVPEIKEVKFVF